MLLSLSLKKIIVKSRTVVIVILAIILADQALKIWVKTHMSYQEQIPLLGSWFRLFFIENEGMAWGWKFGGEWGKMALTLFRLVAVIFGVFYIRGIVRSKLHPGFIICVCMIFSGALGNLIDSLFYGMIFSNSDIGSPLGRAFPAWGWLCGFFTRQGSRYALYANNRGQTASCLAPGLGRRQVYLFFTYI